MPVLSDLPADILLDLCALLTLRDVAHLICASSFFHCFSKGNHFWEEQVRHRIAPIQCAGGSPSRWALHAKNILKFPDYEHMCRAFHTLSCPLEGLWVLVWGAAGGVCGLTLSEPDGYEFSCLHGEGDHGRLRYADGDWQLCITADSTSANHRLLLSLRTTGNTMFTMTSTGEMKYKYSALPAPAAVPESLAHLRGAVGVFTSCYGPHGLEAVCTSFQPVLPPAHAPNAEVLELCGPVVLYGLKLTGDPNIPARNLTFMVNAADSVSLSAVVHSIGPDTALHVYSIDRVISRTTLRDRLSDIVMCLNGKAQVNAFHDLWDPAWEDITFVLYRITEENRTSFSVIFRDMQYMMDFVPGFICSSNSSTSNGS